MSRVRNKAAAKLRYHLQTSPSYPRRSWIFPPPTVPKRNNPRVVEYLAQTCWSVFASKRAKITGLLITRARVKGCWGYFYVVRSDLSVSDWGGDFFRGAPGWCALAWGSATSQLVGFGTGCWEPGLSVVWRVECLAAASIQRHSSHTEQLSRAFFFPPPTVPMHDNPLVVEQMAQTCWSASVLVWVIAVGLLTILDWARFADHP